MPFQPLLEADHGVIPPAGKCTFMVPERHRVTQLGFHNWPTVTASVCRHIVPGCSRTARSRVVHHPPCLTKPNPHHLSGGTMGLKPKQGKEVGPSLLYSKLWPHFRLFSGTKGPSTWQMKITILCIVGMLEGPRASRYQTGKMQSKGSAQGWMCKWQSQSPNTEMANCLPSLPPDRMKESEKGWSA